MHLRVPTQVNRAVLGVEDGGADFHAGLDEDVFGPVHDGVRVADGLRGAPLGEQGEVAADFHAVAQKQVPRPSDDRDRLGHLNFLRQAVLHQLGNVRGIGEVGGHQQLVAVQALAGA